MTEWEFICFKDTRVPLSLQPMVDTANYSQVPLAYPTEMTKKL